MIKLGKLLHISSSGNLIVRVDVPAPLGATVLVDGARRVGQVGDVFGPKKAPYVSVKTSLDRESLKDLVGKTLFYSEDRGRTVRLEGSKLRSSAMRKGGGDHE